MQQIKSICNQILDLLLRGLPYAKAGIGIKLQSNDFTITTNPNKVNIEIAPEEYTSILEYINGSTNENKFTISGIHLKNSIVLFKHYFQSIFTIKFKKPHQLTKGEEFTLEGFTNTVYNGTYKVTNINDVFSVNITKEGIPQTNLTTGLGYYSKEYIGGLNKVTDLIDETNNIVSYVFDEDYFSPIDILDVDTTKKPYINYLYKNVLCYDKAEFMQNNLEQEKFILIDTSSVIFSPHRSNSNKSDANYSTIGSTSQFTRNVNLNIYYVVDTNTNASDNDIELTKIDRALNLILRRSLEIENGYSTTLTIGNASKDIASSIAQGRLVIEYGIEFFISYVENNNILQFEDVIYPIEKVQVNNDLLIFT